MATTTTSEQTNIFEQASRLCLRFTTAKGLLCVEDLWSLPLRSDSQRANLNDIAKSLNKSVRDAEEEDFVDVPGRTAAQSRDALALEVVKRVIEVRQAENEAAAAAAERKEQKQLLLNLLEQKKTEALGALTTEELQARIAAL